MLNQYFYSAGTRFLVIALQFLIIALITRVGGLELTGVYGQLISLVAVFSVLAMFGQSAATFREIPVLLASGDNNRAALASGKILNRTVFFSLTFTIPLSLLYFFIEDNQMQAIVVYFMTFAHSLLAVLSAIARSYGSVILSEFTKNVAWRLFFFVFLALLYLTGENLSIVELCYLLLASVLAAVPVAYYYCVYRNGITFFKTAMQGSQRFSGLNKSNFQSWLIDSLQVCGQYMDIIIVSFYFGMVEAGVYFLFTRVAALIALPLSITNPVITPYLSRIAKLRYGDVDIHQVRKNTFFNLGPAVFFVIVIAIFSKNIFILLSGSSDYSMKVFYILVIGQFVNTISGPTHIASQLFEVRNAISRFQIVLLLVSLLAMLLAAKYFGLVGIAIIVSGHKVATQLLVVAVLYFKSGFFLPTASLRT